MTVFQTTRKRLVALAVIGGALALVASWPVGPAIVTLIAGIVLACWTIKRNAHKRWDEVEPLAVMIAMIAIACAWLLLEVR